MPARKYDRKICLLGASDVGKTSLVRRFVEGIFEDGYLKTIGVKIDHKMVTVGDDRLNLVVWDIEGETEHQSLRLRYLRGAAGYLFVADGTAAGTLQVVKQMLAKVSDLTPGVPSMLLLNKADLRANWVLDPSEIAALEGAGWAICRTSALTGEGVEDAFLQLAAKVGPRPHPPE